MVPSADNNEMSLQQLVKVLTSLEYNEMALVTTLPSDSSSIAGWIEFSHPWVQRDGVADDSPR
jgi:hypothetical protein